MAKNSFQDIVKKPKKTAKPAPAAKAMPAIPPKANISPKMNAPKINIPKADKKERDEVSKKADKVSSFFQRPTNYPAFTVEKNEKNSKVTLWVIAGVSLIVLVFAVSTLFAGATVTVTPLSADLSLSNTAFTASKDATDGSLAFQTMVLSDSESETLNSSNQAPTEIKASGRVLIYNAFSKAPQDLLNSTRLETDDGHIFRIDNAVTVPGLTVANGQTVPGSVEVGIHADQAGEDYNMGLSDFTIPGFKGSSKYQKFYARSKTETTGGAKGNLYVLNSTDAAKAVTDLTATLKQKLLAKADSELPKGFILFNDAAYFEISDYSNQSFVSATSAVPVKVDGTLSAVILDETKLTGEIASSSVKDFGQATGAAGGKTDVYIPSLKNFNFVLKDQDQAFADSTQDISFTLTGTGKIVWAVDNATLADDLIGKNKSDINDILANYPNIDRMEAVIKPFWRSSFPANKKDITIINTEVQ